ncbi:hypothetical protein AMTRI_Chr07g23290 [Amborella trichopoda]
MSIFDAIKQVVHFPTCTSYFLAFNNRRHRYIYQRVVEGPSAATWRACSSMPDEKNSKLCQQWRSSCSSIAGIFSALLQEAWLLVVQHAHKLQMI